MIVSNYISKKLTSAMQESNIISENEATIYIYCLDYFLEIFFYVTSTTLISLLLHRFPIYIIFLGVIFPLRAFAGGIHASNSKKCTIYSYLLFFIIIILSPYITRYLTWQWVVLFYMSTILIAVLAPVDTAKRRLDNKKRHTMKRKCYIVICILWVTFHYIFLFSTKIYYGTISLCAIIVAISVFAGYIQNKKGN